MELNSCVPCKTFPAFQAKNSMCSTQSISFVPRKTNPFFRKRQFLCSTHDISCVPHKTSGVFHAGHPLCSTQYIAYVPYHPIITSSFYHQNIISSYHDVSNKKMQISFGPKSQEQNRLYHFYPSTKNHRDLNFWTSGVTF